MIRLAISLAAAALIATGGLSAFGTSLSPSTPQLTVIGHVYAHANHRAVSTAPTTEGSARGQYLY